MAEVAAWQRQNFKKPGLAGGTAQTLKKFADGGEADDGSGYSGLSNALDAANQERVNSESAVAGDQSAAETARLQRQDSDAGGTPTGNSGRQSFKEAFAQNRAAGAKTFEWNGKKYTTDLANTGGAKAPAAKMAPSAAPDTGDETQRLARRVPTPTTPVKRAAAPQPTSNGGRSIIDTSSIDPKTLRPRR